MGRGNWWRNVSWNGEIEAAFFNKLARARNKTWYLRNQAANIASNCPEVALRLLDQYFASGGDPQEAEAHFYRARAHIALRNMDAAVLAFEATLAREDAVPNFLTWAFHELPVLIATERMSTRYDRAVEVLMQHRGRLTFPVQLYQWHGALALILPEQCRTSEARNEARKALEAAERTDSGFRYHPTLGLVSDTADEFGKRLRDIASERRSVLRWWRT
jgi:tetratricopeptide (TPR) repeat protein